MLLLPNGQQTWAWSLYNAFTEAAKRRSGRGQLATLAGLRTLFAEAL